MTNEQFESVTGIDPYMWVCTERKKTYANGQSATQDGKRMALEGLTERSEIIESDDFSDDILECERNFRGFHSLYTYYLKPDAPDNVFCDVMSTTSYNRYLSEGYTEDEAKIFASSTYVFVEKEEDLDILDPEEGTVIKMNFESIDANRFSVENVSTINGKLYKEIPSTIARVLVGTEEYPVSEEGLLVMNISGAHIIPKSGQNAFVFSDRYDIEADGFFCEWADEPLIITVACGKAAEITYKSWSVAKDDSDVWQIEERSTPVRHKMYKRGFLGINDFRKAGLI